MDFIFIKNYFQDWRIRSGNWEAPELSPRQLTYAANDALVAINIFWVLLRTQFCSDLSSRFHILSWNGPRLISECIQAVERFIDVRFSSKGWMSGALSSEKQKSTKFLSVLKLKGNSIRKSPLYHNCQLQAPDGQVTMYNMCTVYVCQRLWFSNLIRHFEFCITIQRTSLVSWSL